MQHTHNHTNTHTHTHTNRETAYSIKFQLFLRHRHTKGSVLSFCAFESPVHSVSLVSVFMLLHIGRFYLYDFQPKIKCVFLLCHTAYFLFGCFVCFSIVIAPIFIHFHLSYFTLNLKLYKQHCSIFTVCILGRCVFSILLLRRLLFFFYLFQRKMPLMPGFEQHLLHPV